MILQKKGNVYERAFRMPFDFWGSWVEVGICSGTTQTKINSYTNVMEYETEWTEKLYDLWSGDLEFCKKEKDSRKCFERMEKIAQEKIKVLEAYHPNQYFKFKITFIPIANPKKKIEKIIYLPLYYQPITYKDGLIYGRKCINVISASTKLWIKYYVRIEVLEDMSFPSGIDLFKVFIYNPSKKP